jgi:replication factor A2
MISSQATNHTFQVDDGTGVIDVKQWIDSDQEPEHARPLPKEGDYVHVWGRLKAFNNKRHVGSHILRVVTDFNEVSCHLLEATAVHLYFVRGPPGVPDGAMKTDGMFVDSFGGGAAPPQQNGGGKRLPPRASAAAKRVFELLQSSPQSNEGLHVHDIASKLSLQVNDVFKAGDELLADGAIYTTVDDETWAILEY